MGAHHHFSFCIASPQLSLTLPPACTKTLPLQFLVSGEGSGLPGAKSLFSTSLLPFRSRLPVRQTAYRNFLSHSKTLSGARKDSSMNFYAILKHSLLAMLLLLTTASLALAQTGTTSLRGTVTDKSKSVIIGATVTLTNLGQAQERKAETNATGEYE